MAAPFRRRPVLVKPPLKLTASVPPLTTPRPERATVCGAMAASSLTVRVPARGPETVGAKLILMTQLKPGARDDPQLLV